MAVHNIVGGRWFVGRMVVLDTAEIPTQFTSPHRSLWTGIASVTLDTVFEQEWHSLDDSHDQPILRADLFLACCRD